MFSATRAGETQREMTPLRILVVRLGAMGDIIHALPAVASVKQSFPRSYLAWAVEERWMPLLEGNPFVDEMIPVGRRTIGNVLALRRRLRAGDFDTAIDFQGIAQVGFHGLARATGADLRLSSFASPRIHGGAVLFGNGENGGCSRGGSISGTCSGRRSDRDDTILLHTRRGRKDHFPAGDFILANPFAGWGSKQWPLASYLELARRLDVPLVLNVP